MNKIMLTFFMFIFSFTPAYAEEKIDIAEWSKLPILHQGRIKPLDSFARIYLKTFSGQESLESMKAREWLAESVLNPAESIEKPIFNHRETGAVKSKLYSYNEVAEIIRVNQKSISSLLETPETEWSSDQQNLMALHENFILYTQILRSLTALLPIAGSADNNFMDYKKTQRDLNKKIKTIIRRKGTDIEKYSDEEKEIAALSYQLNLMQDGGQNNVLMRVIPHEGKWNSPWASIQDADLKETEGHLRQWQALARAYGEGDSNAWAAAIGDLKQNAPEDISFFKLEIEKIYNFLSLITLALIFYALSFFALVAGNLMHNKKFVEIAYRIFINAVAFHFAHMALRVFILERPPVGTLYESILFVSLICAIGFGYMAWKQKNSTTVLLGSLSGVILLATGTAFASEDNMSTLVAVLNTNFWLSTHVICITIGYAFCLITSLYAHYYLAQKIIGNVTNTLMRNIKTLAILSLLFTTIGTVLGGLWADQSWGRFWGWDPKENGALLIVLWLVWLLHGRVSKHINNDWFAVGMAGLSIVVVLAWFGVNLLNVGLHSYGFISGVAWGIGLFCALEILIIGSLWFLQKRRQTA